MDNDSKLTAIATQEFLKGKKLYILQWPTVLNPVEHVFQFLTKLNTRRPTNKQQSLTSSNPFYHMVCTHTHVQCALCSFSRSAENTMQASKTLYFL